jgi:hypothetical protein
MGRGAQEVSIEMSWGLHILGWFGEIKTAVVTSLFLPSSDYVVTNNVTIRTRRGTTQIDHVIVSRFGVFVVETKNMSGWIFGDADGPVWTKVNRKNRLKFQNPLQQNAGQGAFEPDRHPFGENVLCSCISR